MGAANAEIPPFTDNDVVQHGNLHYLPHGAQHTGNGIVLRAGLAATRRMVVDKNSRNGMVGDGGSERLAGVDGRLVHQPHRYLVDVDDGVCRIQRNQHKILLHRELEER